MRVIFIIGRMVFFVSFLTKKINKIAGNKFLENIELNEKFKSIHVIGNLHPKDQFF